MADLELQLTELAAALEWPPAPDLSAGNIKQITSPPMGQLTSPLMGRVPPSAGWGHGGGDWYRNRWAVAAVAVIVAAAALVAYAPSPSAIAGWVNLHVFLQQTRESPPSPSPLPSGPLGTRLGLGPPTTLETARSHIAWKVAIPATLGSPDEVYLQLPPEGPSRGEVSLVYSSRPGIPVSGQTGVSVLITEARGAIDKNFFGKMLGPGTRLQVVATAGHVGYWISGQPHIFVFTDASGSFRDETMRLATNTLIFDDGGTIVRIEGNLTIDKALQIAASLS